MAQQGDHWDRTYDDIQQEVQNAFQTEASFQMKLNELLPVEHFGTNIPRDHLSHIRQVSDAHHIGPKVPVINSASPQHSPSTPLGPAPFVVMAPRAMGDTAVSSVQQTVQQKVAQVLQQEMHIVRQEVQEQVGACWQVKAAELEFVLRERFTALQELYDNNRFIILEVGNRMLAFKREIRNDVQRYNHLMENIVHQFKHLLKDEITRMYEAISELRADAEKGRTEVEQRCHGLESRVAREWRQWLADVTAQQQSMEERVSHDVRTLHGTVSETMDVVKSQVQGRLDRIDDQVVGVLSKKASLSLAHEQAEQRFNVMADRRVEFLEGEVNRITGLLLQFTERQKQEQLEQLEQLHRLVAEQISATIQQMATQGHLVKECHVDSTADRSLRKLKDGMKDLARDVRRTQSEMDQLQRRLDELHCEAPPLRGSSSSVLQAPEPVMPLVQAMQKQVADLQGTVQQLQAPTGLQPAVDPSALQELRGWVEARLGEFTKASRAMPPAAPPADLSNLQQQVDSMQSSLRGLESRVSLQSDDRGSISPGRAAAAGHGGLSKAVQEYVDEQVAVLSGELSVLRHTVTRKLEPQVDRLVKATHNGADGGTGGGQVDIAALKEALKDWVEEQVNDCFNLYLSHIKERIASQELRLQKLEASSA